MDIERKLTVNGIVANPVPELPAEILAQLAAGTLEARERLTYNPNNNTITSRLLYRQPSTTFPTPASEFFTNLSQAYSVNVEKMYISDKPTPNMLIVGTVRSNDVRGPFDNFTGAPVAISMGFTSDFKTITNVTTVVAGVATIASGTGAGTLNIKDLPGSGTGGPGTPATGPKAVVGAERVVATTQSHQLDGSKSEAGPDGPITYLWKVVGKTASLANATTAMPTVQFGEGFGDYIFELTVTDTKGVTSTARQIVTYTGLF
jgi:hypothetical protein